MPGRKFDAGSGYRYGFNRKENDTDINSVGQDYGMRIYDGRIGKFLSVDPLTSKYPFYTPYLFAGNKPIAFIDRDGMEEGLDFALDRDVKAMLDGKMTEKQYCDRLYARGIGGLIGGIIAIDALVTKGKITEFLLTSEILGHLYCNRSGDPAENVRRNVEFKGDLARIFIGLGFSTVLSKAFSIFGNAASKEIRISTKISSSDKVNSKFIEKGWNAPYKAGVTIAEFKTTANVDDLVRVSGANNIKGDWFTTAAEIKGLTPAQLKDKFSLTYEPTYFTPVTIEKGATVRVGEAAQVDKLGTKGGGFQIEKIDGKVTYGKTEAIKY